MIRRILAALTRRLDSHRHAESPQGAKSLESLVCDQADELADAESPPRGRNKMNGNESFLREVMLFLTEKDIAELSDKAGVRFPIVSPTWSDLCYICAWVSLTRQLPESLHNRMLLGEVNEWIKIYLTSSAKFREPACSITAEIAALDALLEEERETSRRSKAGPKPKPARQWRVAQQVTLWDEVSLVDEFEADDGSAALTSLTPEAAENLAKTDGPLYLDCVTAIEPQVAARLAKHKGELSLDGLTGITPAVAEAFAAHAGGLSLGGLTSLSPDAARALARHAGDLFLDGLGSLSPELAEILASCRGGLSPRGVTKLSPAVAEALAKHRGELGFGMLESLPLEVAEALALHEGDLGLGCLETLSPQAAEALARHNNKVHLTVLNISQRASEALASNPNIIIWDESNSNIITLDEVNLDIGDEIDLDSETSRMTSPTRGSGHWLIDMEAYHQNVAWASVQADRVKALIMELGGATKARTKISQIFLVRGLCGDRLETARTFLDTLCRSLEMGGSPGEPGSGGRAEAATEAADLILEICESFRFSRRVGHQD